MVKNKIEFSVLVREKMKQLKKELESEHGTDKAKSTLSGMMKDISVLEAHAQSGVSISQMYNIETEYRYLFSHHNYFFYRTEPRKVIIVQMFHEREDFMMKLFGVSGRTQESIDYWGE